MRITQTNRLHSDLRLQPGCLQFPANRAALPGRFVLHVYRADELPEFSCVERFSQKPWRVFSRLIEQASRCDQEEDQSYRDKTGYEIPEDLQFKQDRLAKIQAAKQALEAREAALNSSKAIEDSKQISFADTEARIMGKKGQFDYDYNGHRAASMPSIKSSSANNLQAREQTEVDAYITTDKGEKTHKIPLDASERKRVKADFIYNESTNTFPCPDGHILTQISEFKDGSRVYQCRVEACAECPFKPRCCQSEKGQARTISIDDKEPLRQDMNRKMQTPAAQATYKQRKVIAEPVFGQLKNRGFRGFSVRGKDKVAGEFSIVCAAHNFKKIAKAILMGLIRPEFGNCVIQPAI